MEDPVAKESRTLTRSTGMWLHSVQKKSGRPHLCHVLSLWN